MLTVPVAMRRLLEVAAHNGVEPTPRRRTIKGSRTRAVDFNNDRRLELDSMTTTH
jgi:hypothetical protein